MPEEELAQSGIGEPKSSSDYDGLVDQYKTEYKLAYAHLQPKLDIWKKRLKLYNNQRRKADAIGDTTLFTVMQTVLASLYSDRFSVAFGGREEGDDEQADNLEAMAEFDYEEMEKAQIDYDWDFDTCFFGRGIVNMEKFIRVPDELRFYPVPEVINPLIFLRDEEATSINGKKDTRTGAARYFGYPVRMSEEEIKDNPFTFDDIDFDNLSFKSGNDKNNIFRDAKQARDEAQGRQDNANSGQEDKLGANGRYDVMQWYTFYKNGDGDIVRVKCWIADGSNVLLGVQELKEDYWKFVDRPLYPTAHDWDGVSIPDLVEDKQRARSVIANLSLRSLKSQAYPMYVYDQNKITNRQDLQFGFDKFVPINAKTEPVGNAIIPLGKSRQDLNLVNFVYNTLDISAQKATATPDLQQGIQSQQERTLGEVNIQTSRVDTRYSLSAKVFGWSEKVFWQMWYKMYYDYFADNIDVKVLRIVGAFGAKWRPLEKKDFITRVNPDITVESREVNRAKEIEERRDMFTYMQTALADPSINKRYALKKMAHMFGLEKDEVDRLFPRTVDELVAEDENELLNKNEPAKVERDQNHNVHLEVHAKARDTEAAKAHILTHIKALELMRSNPELFPQAGQPDPTAFGGSQTPPRPGTNQPPTTDALGGIMGNAVKPSQTSGAPTIN